MNFGTLTMLAYWFLGSTLINRTLEGSFVTATDVGVMNTMSVWRQITLFGYIPIQIPNISLLITGMARVAKYDYSFFGGQAGYFQYAMYAVTFAIAVSLFLTIIVGLVSNFLNRIR